MQIVRVVGWLLGGILSIVALYLIGSSLLWLLYAVGVALYWMIASVFTLAIIFFSLGFILMIGHWLWPGDIDITYIAYDEGEELA